MKAEVKEEIIQKLRDNRLFVLRRLAGELAPDEVAEIINDTPELDWRPIFRFLDRDHAREVFEFLDVDIQFIILESFPTEQIADFLNALSPDDRTQLFEHIPPDLVRRWLMLMSSEERRITNKLLAYPEDSIGRLMTTDFISVRPDMSVSQALAFIREHGKDSETLDNIYVVDEKGLLIDDLRIRELLLAPVDKIINELSDKQYTSLNAMDDQEKAIPVFRDTDRYALPVTGFDGLLLGIVTVDDMLDIMEAETTEDVQKIGGTEAFDEPYFKISILRLAQKRGVWLIVLFLGEMLTATAMSFFQDEISKAVVLALFVPLIISSGGNSGSQAATIIIRAMALGEISISDWWRVMRREFLSGLILGTVLGIIGFLRIVAWTFFTDIYGAHWLLIAFTVGFSLIGVVMWGTLSGSMLPILLKKLGLDPAVSSAPFVATLVDVTGLVIYFSFALLLLKGILL